MPFLVFAFGVHRAFCPSTLVEKSSHDHKHTVYILVALSKSLKYSYLMVEVKFVKFSE